MVKSHGIRLAIVGATGAVGRVMLSLLMRRSFPVDRLYLLASTRSAGTELHFHGIAHTIQNIADFDFRQVNIALFSAGSVVSAEYVPKAVEAGCWVIDNTSRFRYEHGVPLVIPEVNAHALPQSGQSGIIANPNCSTIQMLVALKPIYDAVGIARINVATYQSVSGCGEAGVVDLARQTEAFLEGTAPSGLPPQNRMAFNVRPHIDRFEENGYTREEMKMHWETQKILEDPDIAVNATAVRVPVFYGHSEALHIETRTPISIPEVHDLLRRAPGVILMEDTLSYPTPAIEGSGHDAVYVGRVRRDLSHSQGINLWVVADNLRKGAALNALQIAESLLELACF